MLIALMPVSLERLPESYGGTPLERGPANGDSAA
jgi:hypothetical protein